MVLSCEMNEEHYCELWQCWHLSNFSTGSLFPISMSGNVFTERIPVTGWCWFQNGSLHDVNIRFILWYFNWNYVMCGGLVIQKLSWNYVSIPHKTLVPITKVSTCYICCKVMISSCLWPSQRIKPVLDWPSTRQVRTRFGPSQPGSD